MKQKPFSPKQIAKRIRDLAKKKDWTMTRTLATFQISPPTIFRWEKGYFGPSVDTYFRVMNKLDELEGADHGNVPKRSQQVEKKAASAK